ncbi:MAG: FtsX-like permease family protein, partial [Acidobacteriota bacterium]
RQRLRSVLVFSQVALALMLLVGAGLMLRTVRGLLQVDPGFEGEGVVSFSMAAARGLEDPQLFTFYDELLARLGALPDVASVGAVTHLPMASLGAATSYFPVDRPEPEAGQAPVADIRVLRGDYLGTLGIPLLSGRAFDSRDRAGQEPGSILISRAAAERHWPGDSAIGRELRISWGDGGARRVIGVVGDVHHADLLSPPRDAIYFPQDQERERAMTVVLRTSRTLRDLAPDLRGVVTVLDPALPIYDLRRVDGVVSESLSKQRFLAAILGIFALLALSLAALGIYGITALSVHQSTREIGLRMALGASPWGVAGLFLRRTAVLTVSALALGGVASVLLGRSVESLLFGVRATDPVNLLGMALLLAIAALIAALVPARRAARLDPTVALRWE